MNGCVVCKAKEEEDFETVFKFFSLSNNIYYLKKWKTHFYYRIIVKEKILVHTSP